MSAPIRESLQQKYARLAATKPGVSRVGWQDRLQQERQFAALLDLEIDSGASVLDVGCGTGDLLAFLHRRGFDGPYTGLDLLPRFVSEGQGRFADRPQTCFRCGDVLSTELVEHDFVLASGLFDYAPAGRWADYRRVVERLAGLARRAVAWNGYSRRPAGRPDMWSATPAQVATLCQELAVTWRLQADYAPDHYTAILFKRAYWLTPALQTLIGHLFLDPSLRQTLFEQPQQLIDRYGVTYRQLSWLDGLGLPPD